LSGARGVGLIFAIDYHIFQKRYFSLATFLVDFGAGMLDFSTNLELPTLLSRRKCAVNASNTAK
jgi:hypothetical protein